MTLPLHSAIKPDSIWGFKKAIKFLSRAEGGAEVRVEMQL